jgi:outer membrane protein TolC
MTVEQYSVDLGIISWEIDFFGRIRSLKDRALEEYLATEQARQSAQILLVSAVANAYLALAADRENLKLAENTLETQKSAYDLIRRRCDVGLASELDLNQAQTQVDTARGDIARFTRFAAQDENALNLLVGSPRRANSSRFDSVSPREFLPAFFRGAPAPAGYYGGGTSTEGSQRLYRRGPGSLLPPHFSDNGGRNREQRTLRSVRFRTGNVEFRAAGRHADF